VVTACKLLRVDKKVMVLALHREHAPSDVFVASLLTQNIRCKENLVDQIFNYSEKRLELAGRGRYQAGAFTA
jgi:CRP/FNR family transcriptional regulator, cyclic AMP receptor protein